MIPGELMEYFVKNLADEQARINECLAGHAAELDATVRPVAGYVLEAGGKRLRPMLTLLCGRAFGCNNEALYTMGCAIEFFHAASLLHDDILDDADLRRGAASAHTIFGLSRTILSGDALLAASVNMVAGLGRPDITALFAQAAMRTAAGQIAEINCLRKLDVDYSTYLDIIVGKTAWVIRCACEFGALYAGAPREQVSAMAEFGQELGIAFQLVDDALDFSFGQETGKPLGGDLREGKLTPPVRFYTESLNPDERASFADSFSKGGFSDQDIKQIIERMRALDCLGRTRALAGEHFRKALAALAIVPKNPELELLATLAEYLQTRNH